VAARTQPSATIIVGDAFELWQSTTDDCLYSDKDFGCTEANALARLSRVIANHRDELDAIGTFAKKGTNRVVLVPGNHDAALLFESVARTAVASTGAEGAVTVNRSGSWISPDGTIYAEHGHQIGKEVNRFADWPRPFVGTPLHLQRPWGEQFVQRYYNKFEAKYPIIDNILSEGVGVHYAIKAEGSVDTARRHWTIHRLFLDEAVVGAICGRARQRVRKAVRLGHRRGARAW